MYFLEKVGVYRQGVYWIGEDLVEGMVQADHFANTDRDDYHSWEVYEFKPVENGDDYLEHELVYRGVRNT